MPYDRGGTGCLRRLPERVDAPRSRSRLDTPAVHHLYALDALDWSSAYTRGVFPRLSVMISQRRSQPPEHLVKPVLDRPQRAVDGRRALIVRN
jgi:hypothetical protein